MRSVALPSHASSAGGLPTTIDGIDRVAAHRHSADAEDRELLGVRVVARVVAERPLDADVVLRDGALEDDLGVRRHLEVDRLALHELDLVATQEAGHHQLVDVVRERRADASRPSPGRARARRRPGSCRLPPREGLRDRPCASASACTWSGRRSTCMRYMPTLRVPVGSFVITAGRVMNGAGSPGQQVWIGSRLMSTSSP